jgi:hypothetical protein
MAKNPAAVSLGRKGGLARGEALRNGTITLEPSGAAVGTPARCPRCGEMQASGRQAAAHCRKKRKAVA